MDSPLVNTGDVLLVRPGIYKQFSTSKGLEMIGLGTLPENVVIGSLFGPPSYLQNADGAVRFFNLQISWLIASNCTKPLRLDSFHGARVELDACTKVRVENLTGTNRGPIGYYNLFGCAVRATNGTFAELVRCHIIGSVAAKSADQPAAALVESGSLVRFTLCNIYGQDGSPGQGYPPNDPYGGDGADALRVRSQARVQVASLYSTDGALHLSNPVDVRVQ